MTRLLSPIIALVDVDDHTIAPADLVLIASALQTQLERDWAPSWGTWATVIVGSTPEDLANCDIQIQLRATPTAAQAGALALHDELPDGTIVAYAFPQLCRQYSEEPSVAISHEILELMGDPYLRRSVQLADGVFMALEVADAVQADSYLVGTVSVSNFCTPEYFEPPANLAGVKFDHLGFLKASGEVRPGGYSQTFDPTSGWVQHQTGAVSGYRAALATMGLSRAARRKSA